MISHFGYRDASGAYYVSVDSERCTGCGACVTACPQQAVEVVRTMVDIDERDVAQVKESCRRRLAEVCGVCASARRFACAAACVPNAIRVQWRDVTSE